MEINTVIDQKGNGAFFLEENGQRMGEMVFEIREQQLTVFHTEILPEYEGRGLASKLLEAMVAYAREHQMRVVPLCPYVHLQFKRHPDLYNDLWKQDSTL